MGRLIKMVLIHLNFYLMPAPGYFGRYQPIDKTAMFLLYKLVFLLAHHYRNMVRPLSNTMIPGQCMNIISQLPESMLNIFDTTGFPLRRIRLACISLLCCQCSSCKNKDQNHQFTIHLVFHFPSFLKFKLFCRKQVIELRSGQNPCL